MKINVGSTNQVKVQAVAEALKLYDDFSGAQVGGVKVASDVSDQPRSMEETIRGAKNRAQAAYQDRAPDDTVGASFGFGIESGLMSVPHTKTGYMDFSVCAIYDGNDFHLGFSPALECPQEVIDCVEKKGMNLNEAFYHVGLTDNPEVGSAEGMIGLLTKNRMTRKDYTKQAILMAMIHLDN